MSDERKTSGSTLAILLSLAASAVSVLAFGASALTAARGSDVTLFPVEDVMIYGQPGYGGALGVSLQTELANIASERFPDAIVDQRLEIARGDAPYACFTARSEVVYNAAPVRDDGVYIPPPCEHAECVNLRGLQLALVEGPSRRTIEAGKITSTRQAFDALSIPRHSRCAESPPPQKTLANFLEDARGASFKLKYHAETFRDGGWDSACTVKLSDSELAALTAQGWGFFPCTDAIATRSPDERSFWKRVEDFFANLV